MKYLTLLAVSLPCIAAFPQTSQKAASACRILAEEPTFPKESDWKSELPNAVARGPQKKLLHPDYRLNAKTPEEVVSAVKFAAKHNVRLSAIHSGHDGLGRNDAPSGLLLSLEGLGGVRIEQSFTPSAQGLPKVAAAKAAAPMAGMAGMAGMKRSPHGPDGDSPMAATTAPKPATQAAPAPAPAAGKDAPYAVTFGAGITTQQLNDQIATQGIFTNGAEHGEVGIAGGWTQCGGHGPMTSAYGLGSDNVLEFQVVTADGQLKIANSVANPDLFWALRGGCGGTYGIVTQATIRAFPSPKFTVTKFALAASTPEQLIEPMAYLHAQMPDLSDKGVQGYYVVFPKQFIGTFHTVGSLATAEASKKIWEPVMAKLATYPGIDKASTAPKYLDYPSYKAYYDATWGPAEADAKMKRGEIGEPILDWWTGKYRARNAHVRRHGPGEAKAGSQSMGKVKGDGRLLSKENLLSPKFAAALKEAMPSAPGKMMRGALVGGGAVITKSPTETSVHPSWRKTYVSIWSDKDVDDLITLSPGMGAYINEASYNATNWQETFWGSNYPKLAEIKTKYDPDMLFFVTPGINADMMTTNEKGALCRATTVVKNSKYPPVGDNTNVKG